MVDKCNSCEHRESLFFTDDEKEIAELKRKEILHNKEIFYKTAKEIAAKNTRKKSVKEIVEEEKKEIEEEIRIEEETKKIIDGDQDKLLQYIQKTNCEDTNLSSYEDGFLREPRTDKERKESEKYCLQEPYEPDEISDIDPEDIKNCGGYKKKTKQKKGKVSKK